MTEQKPVNVLCIYRIKDGKEAEFRPLLESHWPTLDSIGLVSSEPARWYQGQDKSNQTCFIEIFQWKDEKAPELAHQTPEVLSIWEPMGALVDHMEFIHMDPVGQSA